MNNNLFKITSMKHFKQAYPNRLRSQKRTRGINTQRESKQNSQEIKTYMQIIYKIHALYLIYTIYIIQNIKIRRTNTNKINIKPI